MYFRTTVKKLFAGIVVLIGMGMLIFYFFLYRPPSSFPYASLVHVERYTSLTRLAENLKNQHIIRSETLFKVFVVLVSKNHKIVEGDYYFMNPTSALGVAQRISQGQYGLTPTKVTFPEGSNTKLISEIISQKIPDFDTDHFLQLAQGKEGYLFPDTYFFFQNISPERVIESMSTNFNDKIKAIKPAIAEFNKPLSDIVIMASILESEANTPESRRIISGILWNRIANNMPLQVDSTFSVINGKNSAELSLKDLTIDSPYNTYKHTGLPAGPITNPGLDALMAAVSPAETDYVYFLSDTKGNMYYAKTLAEHIKNRQKYLNQ